MKNIFKPNVSWLLVLIFISTNSRLMASHIIGAEISYKQVEGSLYHFTLKVFRDCNECKFNNVGGGNHGSTCPEVPNLKVKGAYNSLYSGDNFGEVQLSRTRVVDMTPTCYGAVSKCRIGSTVNYGFELQQFEGTFDFNNLVLAGKCEFDISVGISSRSATISSMGEQNFFNFTYLNLCSGVPNRSARFDLPPVFSLLQNQTHNIALGIVNDDNDSLSFKLKPALINRAQNVNYGMGRNYTSPYSVYCLSGANCLPNPFAPLAEGFYISGSTGDLIFTPTILNEGSVIVVECEEWKRDLNGNMYLAGVTRRDIYAEVINSTNNLPKIKNNELQIDLCEGEAFNYLLNIEDIRLFGPLSDSIEVNMVSGLANLKLSKHTLNLPPFNFYDINLNNTMGMDGKYMITVQAKDNNCPMEGYNSKTIILNILKQRDLEYTFKTKNCGLLQVESKLKNQSIRWTLFDINLVELKKHIGAGFNHQLLTGGQYILKASLDATNNLCAVNLIDTIEIEDFKNPELVLPSDMLLCVGSEVSIEPVTFNTYDDFKLLMDNTEVGFPLMHKATKNKRFVFRVVQENGCFVEDFINVNIHPVLERSFTVDTICTNHSGQFDIDKLVISDRTKIRSINLSSPNSKIAMHQIDQMNWNGEIVLKEKGKVQIISSITDINNCHYLDTFYLELIEPDPIDIKLQEFVCANAGIITLPCNKDGIWKSLNTSGEVSGNQLQIKLPNSGSIELEYTEYKRCNNSMNYSIIIRDTTPVFMMNGSDLVLCENALPLMLSATPKNGTWQGSFVDQNTFFPAYARNTKNAITYRYTDKDGCTSVASMFIEVIGMPELTVESNHSTICVGDELILSAKTGAGLLNGYWYSDGDGRFDHPDQNNTIYIPSENDILKGKVNFTFTIITNTICGNITEGVEIMINEGPKGKIISDYKLNQCEPASFKFATNFTNVTRQNWYINDTLVEEFDYAFEMKTVLKSGIYRIKTVVMNGDCAATDYTEQIEIYPTPSSGFISNPNYRLSREYPRLYLRDVTSSKRPFTSSWYFDGKFIGNEKEFYYNIETQDDTFNIRLVNTSLVGGCENEVSRKFVFSPINQLYIPDAFSPDLKGPEENNEFKVKGTPMQYFYIEIYDKWGAIVFKSKEMDFEWDGNYGGKPAIAGVYFYKINSTDLNGVSRDYSGTVTLIR